MHDALAQDCLDRSTQQATALPSSVWRAMSVQNPSQQQSNQPEHPASLPHYSALPKRGPRRPAATRSRLTLRLRRLPPATPHAATPSWSSTAAWQR